MGRNVYLVIGSIGSGKTYFSRKFVSSDILRRPMFVSSDEFKNEYFNLEKSYVNKGYRAADDYFFENLYECLREKNNRPLVIEFCPLQENKIVSILKILGQFKTHITTLFVNTESKTINVERAELRAAKGSDKVNRDKIEKSYDVALEKVLMFVDFSNELYLIDNSKAEPKFICQIKRKTIDIYDDNCAWANKIISSLKGD